MTQKKRRPYEPNPSTPLDNWSKNIDPFIMSGQHWEEEENAPLEADVGWEREENKDLLQGIQPQSGIFMHPTHDVSYDQSSAKDKGEKI